MVWTLDQIFALPFAESLTFKGGTSLSKVYRAIDRFSEDIDLTYDIRALLPDEVSAGNDWLPATRSKAKDVTDAVEKRLPVWIEREVQAPLAKAVTAFDMRATVRAEGDEAYVEYEPLSEGTAYVRPIVRLEFGARATGEPNHKAHMTCDAAEHVTDVAFPTADPSTMDVERTFWEKATAIHVYCHQGRFRGGDRFARHWYDLTRLDRSGLAARALAAKDVARAVAKHKALFFREKDAAGNVIDYTAAVTGGLSLVPSEEPYHALGDDYARMVDAGLLFEEAEPFDKLMATCADLERRANGPVS